MFSGIRDFDSGIALARIFHKLNLAMSDEERMHWNQTVGGLNSKELYECVAKGNGFDLHYFAAVCDVIPYMHSNPSGLGMTCGKREVQRLKLCGRPGLEAFDQKSWENLWDGTELGEFVRDCGGQEVFDALMKTGEIWIEETDMWGIERKSVRFKSRFEPMEDYPMSPSSKSTATQSR